MKIVRSVGQMHRDDAVFLFSHGAQVLPLNTRSLLPLLDEAGFIDDAHGMRIGMFLGDNLLQAVACQIFLPTMLAEELLQRPHRHVACQRDRLDALARKVRKLALHIDRQMSPRILACKTVVKAFQKTGEHRLQSTNLFGIHAVASLTWWEAIFANVPKQGKFNLAL